MTTTTLTVAEQKHVAQEVEAQMTRLGLPSLTASERSAIVSAIGKATPETLLEVARAEGPKVYVDPSNASAAARVASEFARQAKLAADEMHRAAIRLSVAARKADPKVKAVDFGRAIENVADGEAVSAAFRKRWSRYFAIAEASTASGKAGNTINPMAALKAITSGVSQSDLLASAAAGHGVPEIPGRAVTDAAGNETARVFTPAQVISNAERLLDSLKGVDLTAFSPDQRATLAGLFQSLRSRADAFGK